MDAKGAHFSYGTRRMATVLTLTPTWSWMKKQMSETSTATNMVDWKKEVTELWVLRMSDGQYLVESKCAPHTPIIPPAYSGVSHILP